MFLTLTFYEKNKHSINVFMCSIFVLCDFLFNFYVNHNCLEKTMTIIIFLCEIHKRNYYLTIFC